jgi:hypothetical protein
MGRILMLASVPGDESHRTAPHRAERDRCRRIAEGGVDLDLFGILEHRVEPGAAEHAQPDLTAPARSAQAVFSLLVEPDVDDPESDDVDPEDDDAPESPPVEVVTLSGFDSFFCEDVALAADLESVL